MSDWLKVADKLVNAREASGLVQVMLDTLQHDLHVDKSFFVAVTPDGRQLITLNRVPDLCWNVTDFECPFAHVLQNGGQKIINHEHLVYWEGDTNFTSLIDGCRPDQKIVITPLHSRSGAILALSVNLVNVAMWINEVGQSNYLRFLNLFTRHWEWLGDLNAASASKSQLKESLSYVEQTQTILKQSDSIRSKLVGDSTPMKALREQIATASQSDMTVLIQGETGVGKDVVASAIHELSSRRDKSLVAINCAAIPENLLESELFGYTKGAFSGATSNKPGLIALADGGTLFLDEIGDMPPMLQAKLLRVLETRTFRPLGAEKEQSSDFRLVAATHVELRQKIEEKTFRQDLFYRLYQFPLNVPSLKERMEDVEVLAKHFIDQFNQANGTRVRGIHFKALDMLMQYTFPGNVRELRHLIEFGCAHLHNGHELMADELGRYIQDTGGMAANEDNVQDVPDEEQTLLSISDLRSAVKSYESKIIAMRLRQYKGDRSRAAESLGIPKRTLADKCSKLEINI
ncbi:sigma 54-interacting transcriptional regulator [Vibrio sp. SCSIO 43132]|uniref:sigma-54 interaction domain-containing protein n=1 Tax=Vibrio sp. SCSIO 43132 TaxID=2779363 RepID=UPI001CA8F5F2|nr:sigma 54-interacting transcriptional regulator [Vibrio sp. SCSIO 43132]UAB73574.1 sigma 54-interacting transcriptional regulator [Vibrio sp. SCSIO 43132]